MNAFTAEMIGTLILVLLGDGVVANVVLKQSKGNGGGWIVVTAGWAFGVTVAVYCVNTFSGAHLNPAVTVGLAAIGKFSWALVPGYVLAQVLGGILGARVLHGLLETLGPGRALSGVLKVQVLHRDSRSLTQRHEVLLGVDLT